MKLGFSGTQWGLTPVQTFVMHGWLSRELRDGDEFHHGDCVGADMSAAGFVAQLKWAIRPNLTIHGHPALVANHKRGFSYGDVWYPPMPPLRRNEDLVVVTDRMLFTPHQDHEIKRSGTWSTVRVARRENKPYVIIYPNGKIEEGKQR